MTDAQFAALLMAPAAVFLAVFVAWPVVKLFIDSFFDVDPMAGTSSFVGVGNYVDALTSSDFQAASVRTVIYTLMVVTFEFSLGLASALLFHTLGKRSDIFRTIFLYPLMIAPVVAGLLWRFLMIDNFGIVGSLLAQVGILNDPNQIGWLSNPNIVLFSVAIPDIWLTTSFMTLILFAGLQNVPPELLEAARLDGAGPWQLLWRIVLPLLRPVIAVVLIIRGIDATRAFDVILIQTDGGPQNATETLSLQIYRTMIRFSQPGLASAMSVLYLAAMVVVAVLALRFIWRPGRAR